MNHLQAIEKIETAGLPKGQSLAELWEKVRPLVGMLSLVFGKKVKPFINAFIAALDELTAKEVVVQKKKRGK